MQAEIIQGECLAVPEHHVLRTCPVCQCLYIADLGRLKYGRLELGYHLARTAYSVLPGLAIRIGIEPGYAREQDVRIQTLLVYPQFKFATSLSELCSMVVP